MSARPARNPGLARIAPLPNIGIYASIKYIFLKVFCLVCGNGNKVATEACDDGNINNGTNFLMNLI